MSNTMRRCLMFKKLHVFFILIKLVIMVYIVLIMLVNLIRHSVTTTIQTLLMHLFCVQSVHISIPSMFI